MKQYDYFTQSEEQYIELKKQALAHFIDSNTTPSDITHSSNCLFWAGGDECDDYFVGTLEESQRYMSTIINDTLLAYKARTPPHLQLLLSELTWIKIEKARGCAHHISRDDIENSITIDNITFKIYRI